LPPGAMVLPVMREKTARVVSVLPLNQNIGSSDALEIVMPGRSKKLSRVASVSSTDLNRGPVSASGPAGSPRNVRKLSMIFWRQAAAQLAREVWSEGQSACL